MTFKQHRIEYVSWTATVGLLFSAVLFPASVSAHAERMAFFPEEGRVAKAAHPARALNEKGQPVYRPLLPAPASPRLVVCKKPGNEGIGAGQDSAALIAKFSDAALKNVNQQLLGECAFEHLQAAVDAVTVRGTTIYILPGVYREQPSIRALEENFGAAVPADREYCRAVLGRGPGKLSYEEQYRCRFIQNTVAIFGDPDFTDDNCGDDVNGVCTSPQTQLCDSAKSACPYYDLQVEGTGEKITDVVFTGDFITKPGDAADAQFRYLNGIRADRADGIFLSNFTTQIYEFNAVYVMETDGYVFDRLLSRWVDEYAFLSFASDHGLYDYTEGYGVADSVQYPGSGADVYKNNRHADANLRARQATEVRNSKGHHSALGYSGTAGNAPWVHNNEFYKNQTGFATESIFGGHPGMPQDHALWENNKVYSNNKDYYRLVEAGAPCIAQKPRDRGLVPAEMPYFDALPTDYQEAIMDRTVICPPIPFQPGSGMLIFGGNYDVVANNQIFDNWKWGVLVFSIPTLIHKLTDNPQSPLDTAGVAGPIEQNDPSGGFSTVNDAAGAVSNQPDNSDIFTDPVFTAHYNHVRDNRFGENIFVSPPLSQPNGVDIFFDNSGSGNCFVDNSSMQGDVTSDTGMPGPLNTLPTECGDGDAPDLPTQITTARPNRIAEFALCLNYNRNNPDSKDGCPFFEGIAPPAGRVPGVSRVTSANPQQAASVGGALGYFVLHNDSNSTHRVQMATLKLQGGNADGLTLTVKDIFGKSAVASGTLEGDTLTFSFNPAAAVPVQEATLFEIGRATQTASASTLQLAALPLGASGALLLLIGGLRRRDKALLIAAVLLSSLLASCSNSPGGADAGGGGGGVVNGPLTLELVGLQFEGNPADANYSGLPLLVADQP